MHKSPIKSVWNTQLLIKILTPRPSTCIFDYGDVIRGTFSREQRSAGAEHEQPARHWWHRDWRVLTVGSPGMGIETWRRQAWLEASQRSRVRPAGCCIARRIPISWKVVLPTDVIRWNNRAVRWRIVIVSLNVIDGDRCLRNGSVCWSPGGGGCIGKLWRIVLEQPRRWQHDSMYSW